MQTREQQQSLKSFDYQTEGTIQPSLLPPAPLLISVYIYIYIISYIHTRTDHSPHRIHSRECSQHIRRYTRTNNGLLHCSIACRSLDRMCCCGELREWPALADLLRQELPQPPVDSAECDEAGGEHREEDRRLHPPLVLPRLLRPGALTS